MIVSLEGDMALDPHLELRSSNDRDLGGELGAHPTHQNRRRLLRNALILCLVLQFWLRPEGYIFYPRDHNHFARTRRYNPRYYSARNMKWAVDTLEETGLIEHQRTRPSPDAMYRSTLRFIRDVSTDLQLMSVADIRSVPRENIWLKDEYGVPVSYRTTPEIRALRKDVEAQNELLGATDIRLVHLGWRTDSRGLLCSDTQTVNPTRKGLYRIFNNSDWTSGGRWYGGFWQQLPSGVRPSLTLNSEPVVELDIPACHPRLMYALVGALWPGSDPYEIDGFERSIAKRGFNMLVNSTSKRSAALAIAEPFSRSGVRGAHFFAHKIITEFQRKHSVLEPLFCSGIGIHLQRYDSDVCAAVQRKLREQGISVLSIHDSFITPATRESLLEAVMSDVFEQKCREISQFHNA